LFYLLYSVITSRDSSVGIETGYGLDDGRDGVPLPVGAGVSPTLSRQALGHLKRPIQRVPEALSLRVKGPDREADESPPTNAEVKKTWIYTATPPYVSMA
jgi:hypothetical protein